MPYRLEGTSDAVSLPTRRWIIGGGVSLAALAGYVNVVALGVFTVPASHMTGAVSRLGSDLATGNSLDIGLVVLMLAGFLVGATTSGAIIGEPRLEPGRRYGIALVVEAVALAVATVFLLDGSRAGIPLVAFACGSQNGMASSYYGLIIRTTHVTGIVTDLGVIAGQRLRGVRVEPWKPALLSGLVIGFLIGGVGGQLMVDRVGPIAMAPAAGASLLGGLGYYVWRTSRARGRDQPN